MSRLGLETLLVGALVASPIDAGGPLWRHTGALAQDADVSAKEAFEAAKELGTAEAWNAFLASYPAGFYSNLARAYIKKLGGGAAPEPAGASAPSAPAAGAPPSQAVVPVVPDAAPSSVDVPAPPDPAPAPARADASAVAVPADAGGVAPTDPNKPAVARGGPYMGFAEQFNRYYTDPNWKPKKTVFVSPAGGGDGATRDTPMSPKEAVAAATPGTQIVFLRGAYQGGLEFTKETCGTYDDPIVVYAERNPDKLIGVQMSCDVGTRKTCFNLEGADYIAIDGFELVGGKYGVRAIGLGFAAREHSRGVAVLSTKGHGQDRDPFFSGATDWAVWENLVGSDSGKGDGHGIYLSNGGDWNIIRFSETFSNPRSDFQINADPTSTCQEAGIPFTDPRCDAFAGTGEGGQGASDYYLVDGNYFHHGATNGANFTSVRRSVVRNNIFGLHTEKHNVSFWQETDNPKLGSSENKILHNLFVTSSGRHAVKFEANSTRNEFANNVVLGVKISGGKVTANPSALLMEVDDTVGENVYRGNFYGPGKFEGREPGSEETVGDFSPTWFTKFPAALNHDPNDFRPVAGAPFVGAGTLSVDAPADRNGTARAGQVDLGPIEVK